MSDSSKFDFDVLNGLEGESIEVYLMGTDRKVTDMTIDEVERSPAHGGKFDAFSVQLTGSKDEDKHCPQGNYLLKHSAFGEELVFVTPNAADKYHICISREAKQES